MAISQPELRTVRFSDFEVDLRAGELLRSGCKVKFGGQPFQVLSILLEHPGELVTREELGKRLWPDTFVDVDHNLNTAINKIREVLGDSAERPRFVETLPRRGYRFIAELDPPVQPLLPQVNAQVQRHYRSWRGITLPIFVVVTLLTCVVAFIAYTWGGRSIPLELPALSAVPFTALPGRATSPAFSPDGSRIAFAWDGDPRGRTTGYDLYVKALGSETLLRVTEHPSEWLSAAWSPDGTQIAFHRLNGTDSGIYVVPALGGTERKLHGTQIRARDFASIAWSPDGNWIAFADLRPSGDRPSVSLLSMETLVPMQIPMLSSCIAEAVPAFSHNGESLARWCLRRPYDAILYTSRMGNGIPRAVASARAFPTGLTWSRDDKKLVYSLDQVGAGLSADLEQVTLDTGLVTKLAVLGSAMQPTIAMEGGRLAYSYLSTGVGIWRKDLNHPASPAVEIAPSSQAQFDAQYSPDGRHIAFASLRTGFQGVWMSGSDGSELVQVSDPRYASGSPQWSPDGRVIAFDSRPEEQWEIYLAGVAERKPRKLLTTVQNVSRPNWSRDGKWVYFISQESGRMGIYRCPAGGGDAVLLSKGDEQINPRESSDGKKVYFASAHTGSTLKQTTSFPQIGTESKVEGLPRIQTAELWTLSPSGVYFVPADQPKSLRYFDLSTKQVRSVFSSDKNFFSGLSVSPDGRWIIYSQVGEEKGDIRLVEHYR